MLRKIKILLLGLGAILAVGLVISPGALALYAPGENPTTTSSSSSSGGSGSSSSSDSCHSDTTDQQTNCRACQQGGSAQDCLESNPIVKDISLIVDVLAGLVGVVAVVMIVVGGIQYSLARNNPQATAGARTRILNAVIAMIAFMFIWALLQYLVPGGVFNN